MEFPEIKKASAVASGSFLVFRGLIFGAKAQNGKGCRGVLTRSRTNVGATRPTEVIAYFFFLVVFLADFFVDFFAAFLVAMVCNHLLSCH
jgi:hypothetical protein